MATYHQGAFKREVGRREHYMHNGSLAPLEDVVDFYDRGGNPNPHLDESTVPLHRSDAEKRALLEFLRTGLAGSVPDWTVDLPKRLTSD